MASASNKAAAVVRGARHHRGERGRPAKPHKAVLEPRGDRGRGGCFVFSPQSPIMTSIKTPGANAHGGCWLAAWLHASVAQEHSDCAEIMESTPARAPGDEYRGVGEHICQVRSIRSHRACMPTNSRIHGQCLRGASSVMCHMQRKGRHEGRSTGHATGHTWGKSHFHTAMG